MGKYTIETDGITADSIQGYLGFPIEICGKRTWVKTDMELTPYTEDSAYAHGYTEAEAKYREIRDELEKQAYEKGVQDTKQHWVDAPRTCAYQLGYGNGLNDAWEAARKISLAKIDGGFSWESMNNMFGTDSPSKIYKTFTASEVIEKIRQYEQENEEIQIGDEVVGTYTGEEETEPFVIIRKIPEIYPTYYFGIYSKSGEFCQGGLKLKKTGRHFPEIAEVLQKMKEAQ